MSVVNPTGFFPVLTTSKLKECSAFYTQYFGFNVAFEAEWYIHLISENGIQLGFLQSNHSSQPEFLHKSYSGDGVIYSFEVRDVDQEYEKLRNAKVPILLDVKTEDWGQRHFMIKDPSGMVLDVVQATEPSDEYKDQYKEQ